MKTLLFLLLLAGVTLAQTKPAELKKAKADHAKADAKLNVAYKAAMAAMEDAGKAELKKDQRAWLEYRDDLAKAQVHEAADDIEKPESSAAYWDMMAGLSDERTEWLGSYTKELPEGLTGEWMDSHGGHVYLQERKDGVAFGIDVVRTRAFNLGGIGGLAKKTATGADYTEKVPADEKREPCKLTFTVDASGNLEVKSENSEPFHGNRAYFDGTYRKVAKLKKPVDTEHAPNDPEAAK